LPNCNHTSIPISSIQFTASITKPAHYST
jgi:hypothetical protein